MRRASRPFFYITGKFICRTTFWKRGSETQAVEFRISANEKRPSAAG